MRKLVITLSLLIATFAVQAQLNLDSLHFVWVDDSKPDTSRIEANTYYIWYSYLYSQPDTAFALAEDLMTFCKEKNNRKGEAMALHIQGNARKAQSNYPKAIEYFTLSLNIRKEIGDKNGVSSSLDLIGDMHQNLGNYPKAFEYFNLSLKIYEELGMDLHISGHHLGMGNLYHSKGKEAKALEHYERSLKIYNELGHKYITS